MSFNYHARKVRNSGIPIYHRRSALSSCIQNLQWLVKQRYCRLYSYFELNFHKSTDESQLLDRLTAIEVFRNRFLKKQQNFERKRIREKMKGRRQLRKKDVQSLYEIKELEKKSAEI
jgi:hypothetical protein